MGIRSTAALAIAGPNSPAQQQGLLIDHFTLLRFLDLFEFAPVGTWQHIILLTTVQEEVHHHHHHQCTYDESPHSWCSICVAFVQFNRLSSPSQYNRLR